MDLKLELRHKLQLRLVPTAKIQQALKLLQVPALELEQLLKQEMMTNPLLEEMEEQEEEEEEEEQEEEPGPEASESTEGDEASAPDAETETTDANPDEFDWEAFLQDDYEGPRGEREAPPEDRLERVGQNTVSFQDHLLGQLRLAITDPEDYEIGAFIIGSLDDRGYLTIENEEIAETLGVEPGDVARVLRIVQTFDPSGVGARDLGESLLIQLRAMNVEDPLPEQVVSEHLEALKQKRYNEIAKRTHTSLEQVRGAADVISRLNPHPGFEYSVEAARPILPDLIVDRVGEDYIVSLNDRSVPRLRVNQAYADYLSRPDSGDGNKTREYILEKLNSARWVIKAIEQRRRTMVRVMETIVECQQGFFDHGAEHLKPLTRQHVAERVGVHEATVSRATSGKYVQTPRGVFELKYFFSAALATDSGDEVSARRVKMQITELVEKEDRERPLSDQQIVDLLKREGIRVARRTVAKYRDQMNILPGRLRKTP
ncbi:MAG: RNA polymerase factor sigma-54 [Candidatus Eisenbacteria sp.]|nr:RNA polymerase factor sigma-54 [Candidatus Eisenbacteria bacterium]